MGMTLRYFDNKSGKWRVDYIEPPTNPVVELTSGQECGRIVLYGKGRQGSLLRWSFNDLSDNSFTWRGEKVPRRRQDVEAGGGAPHEPAGHDINHAPSEVQAPL